jgi:hypothetical protein
MLEITGTNEEIKRIKSALWYSSDCPLCSNPEKECLKGLKTCGGLDVFYDCIEENIKFITL